MDLKAKVLVLDDVLKAILEKREYEVVGFTDAKEALDALRNEKFDAAITDLYMPEIDGMAFLQEVKRLYPGLPVVMITAFGTVDSAVDAIKQGAFDYVTKPFEQSEIVSVVQKAVNTSALKRLSMESGDLPLPALDARFFGKTLASVMENIRKVAASPSPLLLLGEAGSGKEYLAEEVHRSSDRSFQPLLKVNCAAVSSMNIESEIFGGNKPGKLELAHKGTLFLDEITELDLDLQQRLLDFLESRKVENTVTGEKRSFDVRLLVSARKDIQKEVKEGKFSSDLLYKLNVMPIHLPPLRERKEDLPGLVDFFLYRLNKRLGRSVTAVAKDCMDVFQASDWPGNMRQLESVLERLMLLSDGNEIKPNATLEEIKAEMSHSSTGASFRELVRKQTQTLEKDLIEKALGEMDGNVTRTAEHLGISRKGLQLKMKELGIRS